MEQAYLEVSDSTFMKQLIRAVDREPDQNDPAFWLNSASIMRDAVQYRYTPPGFAGWSRDELLENARMSITHARSLRIANPRQLP